MKSKLMDAHARVLDTKRYDGQKKDRDKTWAELAEYLHLSWWKRVCLWVLNAWKNYRWITKD